MLSPIQPGFGRVRGLRAPWIARRATGCGSPGCPYTRIRPGQRPLHQPLRQNHGGPRPAGPANVAIVSGTARKVARGPEDTRTDSRGRDSGRVPPDQPRSGRVVLGIAVGQVDIGQLQHVLPAQPERLDFARVT